VADPKQEESFKVIDRRLFTEDGDLRKDVVEQEERREEEAAAREATRAATNKQAHADAAKSAGAARQSQFEANSAAGGLVNESGQQTASDPAAGQLTDELNALPADQPEASRSFQMLVDFLVRNAAAMLGGMADPRTGQPFVDLEGAREVIDMLDALREKTRGNLSKEDDQLLLEVVGSLKLTFMEISKAATEAMAKKAKGK
jgi:hypothetical protein